MLQIISQTITTKPISNQPSHTFSTFINTRCVYDSFQFVIRILFSRLVTRKVRFTNVGELQIALNRNPWTWTQSSWFYIIITTTTTLITSRMKKQVKRVLWICVDTEKCSCVGVFKVFVVLRVISWTGNKCDNSLFWCTDVEFKMWSYLSLVSSTLDYPTIKAKICYSMMLSPLSFPLEPII